MRTPTLSRLLCFATFHLRMVLLNETTIEGPSPVFNVGKRRLALRLTLTLSLSLSLTPTLTLTLTLSRLQRSAG